MQNGDPKPYLITEMMVPDRALEVRNASLVEMLAKHAASDDAIHADVVATGRSRRFSLIKIMPPSLQKSCNPLRC